MIKKNLRILIADEHHDQLLFIEKRLNGLGYYRVAPVRTFDELVKLTNRPCELFDLLIVNKSLGMPFGVDITEFCRTRPHIRHALYYESHAQRLGLVLDSPNRSIQAFLSDMPDVTSLSALMSIIDPPLERERFKSPSNVGAGLPGKAAVQ